MRICFPGSAAVRRLSKGALGAVAIAAIFMPLAGCSPPPPTAAELGRIVFSADDMPGGHKRFLLPEIKGQSKPAGEPQGEHDHAGHAPHDEHPPAEGPGADK